MACIAFLDHSFHRTTRSTSFLPEILRRHGHSVDLFWDDAWRGGAPVEWKNIRKHDVVIMFQSFCTPEHRYFRQSHPNVIYVPMLDQFAFWQGPLFNQTAFWEPFQGSKILNFSRASHCMATAFGLVSYCTRYYQPVSDKAIPARKGLHGFFWLRREQEVPWRLVRQLIDRSSFDSLHVHLAVDPGTVPPDLPPTDDLIKHNISTSTWFEDKADLIAVMDRANVIFAPRLEEGIGQSFLEAMARAQCVVAPDRGTMNEYIVHGLNGLLYDSASPRPLDFSNAVLLGERAREGAVLGRASWNEAEEKLVDFVLAPSQTLYIGKYQHHAGRTSGVTPVGATEAEPTVLLDGLRNLAQRNPLLRSTRFVWHPMLRLARHLTGR